MHGMCVMALGKHKLPHVTVLYCCLFLSSTIKLDTDTAWRPHQWQWLKAGFVDAAAKRLTASRFTCALSLQKLFSYDHVSMST